MRIVQFDVDPGQIVPGDRIIRRDLDEPFVILLRLHVLLLVRVDPAEIEERQDIVGKHLQGMAEFGLGFIGHILRGIDGAEIRVVHGQGPIHLRAQAFGHFDRLLHLDEGVILPPLAEIELAETASGLEIIRFGREQLLQYGDLDRKSVV